MCQNSFELHYDQRILVDLLSRVSVLSNLVCNHALPDFGLFLKSPILHHFKLRFNAHNIVLYLLGTLVAPRFMVLEDTRCANAVDVHQSYSRHPHLTSQHTDQSCHLQFLYKTGRCRVARYLVVVVLL